ncbi:hypothetical protein IAE29_22890 [Ochrobactrum sp. S46]|nr:hypothetical protein [Ochrobactrum sp. S45]MBK0046180.1 hypothetical protein [Ochrobactrum sp. S46]
MFREEAPQARGKSFRRPVAGWSAGSSGLSIDNAAMQRGFTRHVIGAVIFKFDAEIAALTDTSYSPAINILDAF